jgi:formylmethanofuran dehydrogenase subunit E
MINREEFNQVVDFHGCYCLDIAMGYRVAKALIREMGDQLENMKEVFAQVGNNTCSVDAIQKLTVCTVGKRNLILTDLGKPVFILQNARTQKAVRAYVHFWDTFDQGELGQLKKQAKQDESAKGRLKSYLDQKIDFILSTPEESLFTLTHISLAPPQTKGKFETRRCESCGEYVDTDYLVTQDEQSICRECSKAH